ncbi:putative aldehyde dehydrogenase [Nocardia brasiliensis NBRC 14402]|uniref:aldehyde dehydrogenase family protein n=1 Tax=Nocardia brasiliensis TaxID=37326 RepID=UPI0002E6CD07|nr:aldehyde dehydrogenase family protein [Nocardia brasiliensis]ASF07372.1 aldehyde dehydrogenase [Nocardia brasiliensis]GAJ86155.1 putative aldehyde dehydrogenase [Nocardia brasiliensis NBRC 14402]SUB47319.1 Succinate-semialdehyde dehydrogenase [NADP(+)] GabD [Nocardia brasiliensis]
MFRDGAYRPAAEEFPVHNPWTGETVGSVARDSVSELDAALRGLRAAWRPLRPDQRATILRTAARLIRERAAELAPLISRESGVCLAETSRETDRAATNLTVAANEAERLRGESIPVPGHDRLALTMFEPIGVVAAITPFNRPLNQVVVKLAPAVAAGCAVVLKPSEKTPLTALAFAEIMLEAGLPPEHLVVTTGAPGELGPALAGHPDVDMVTCTGSAHTGRAVSVAAAGKKLLLELGGNDPLIVLPDADLDLAVQLTAQGAFATAGQSCRGIKRVIAVGTVADDLVAGLVEAAQRKRAGDPLDPATEVGPLISADAADTVARRIAEAVAAQAKLLLGGERRGSLITPAVLDRVPADAELVVEETFGPVAPVIRVADIAEAISVANSTRYGLQAGVVTSDVAAFTTLAAALRVGAVNLNAGPHFDSPHLPFGGVKSSGLGREGIAYSIREMSTVKTVTLPYPR